ncbi:hypothetical protein IGI04_019338, partial [Brassica rapa subsp. trilocularis]
RTRISVNYHTSSNQNTRITTIKVRNRKEREQTWARELSARFLVLATLRRLNLIESQLEITKTENCLSCSNFLLCSSPRTPYILAPRSVYAFTLLPLSRHSIKWRFSIFPDLHNYLQNFRIYPRKLDIYPSSWAKRKPCCGLRAFGGKHGLSLLRSSGDSIRRFDENAWTGVVSMFGKVQSLHSDRTLARARSLRSDRVRRALGRYRPSGTIARSLCSDRAGRSLGRYVATELWLELGRYVATDRARSLRSDRAGRSLGRYVATELWLELGRYVATEQDDRSRPSGTIARSLRSDRAWLGFGCYVATRRRVYVATELGLFGLIPKGYFFVKTSYRLFFTKITSLLLLSLSKIRSPRIFGSFKKNFLSFTPPFSSILSREV